MAFGQKDIDMISAIYGNSKRKLALITEQLDILWFNCSDFRIYDLQRAYGERFVLKTDDKRNILLISEEITLGDEKAYILKIPENEDMFAMLGTEAFQNIYQNYSFKTRSGVLSFLSMCDDKSTPQNYRYSLYLRTRENVSNYCRKVENLDELIIYERDSIKEEVIPPCPYIEDFLKETVEIASFNKYEFEYKSEEFAFVKTDVQRLQCMLANLISNAFRYNKAQTPKAKLTVSSDGRFVTFCVSDNGGGIDKKRLEATKEPFTINDYEPGEPNESLGLYLVRRFASRFNGKVDFENKDGGFCAKVILPEINQNSIIELHTPPIPVFGAFYKKHYNILSKGFERMPDI